MRTITLLKTEKPSPHHSHPTTATRLRYSERFGFGGAGRDQRELSALFCQWDVLNEKAASLYNERYINYFKQFGDFPPTQTPEPPALPTDEE